MAVQQLYNNFKEILQLYNNSTTTLQRLYSKSQETLQQLYSKSQELQQLYSDSNSTTTVQQIARNSTTTVQKIARTTTTVQRQQLYNTPLSAFRHIFRKVLEVISKIRTRTASEGIFFFFVQYETSKVIGRTDDLNRPSWRAKLQRNNSWS